MKDLFQYFLAKFTKLKTFNEGDNLYRQHDLLRRLKRISYDFLD